ncbi:2'-5' RNA ligase family protein [Microlunatus elymi]|uniref:2'-5' RNA ligase family protein n=1 Tax=Microlunatus elymi TaxID=2596828 RepID=A0A516Q514_9ACTN|nr:2'-5' RNA ligase family protein [Microlunatus elymi]QDP98311.1 2'-5' RNA ligase family protein [Microlunatus elymi]
MALAVCLLFDPRSDRLLRDLWARLERQGISTLQSHTHRRHQPHLSYAVMLEWDLASVRAAVEALPGGDPLQLSVQGTVCFPRGRAALAVAGSAQLMERQERVAAAVAASGAMLHRHYQPGRWIPHISVATGSNATTLPYVIKSVTDILPFTVCAGRAALVDSSTGEVTPLPRLP